MLTNELTILLSTIGAALFGVGLAILVAPFVLRAVANVSSRRRDEAHDAEAGPCGPTTGAGGLPTKRV